jgi:hypothetical protein
LKKRAKGTYALLFSPEKGRKDQEKREKGKGKKGQGMGLVHWCLQFETKQKTNNTQTNTQTQQQTRKSLHFEPTRKNMFFHSLHQTQK